MENIHYVYQLRRADSQEPFYVGEGKGDRAYHHLTGKEGSNKHKNNTINEAKRDGVQILIEYLWTGLSKSEA